MTQNDDPRALLLSAIDQAEQLVEQVRPEDDLDRPTPCSDWTVRELVGHLVGVLRRIRHIANGGQPFEVSSMIRDVPDDAWVSAWADARADLEKTLTAEDLLERTFAHPAGAMPAPRALGAYANEMTVHGWDLARAIGSTETLDESLATTTLPLVMAFLPPEPRGEAIPFGPVVGVPDGAPAYDRLVGWLGRDPAWRA